MRVLGIDPGIERLGFAVADIHGRTHQLLACGVIHTPSSDSVPERLVQIRHDLTELLSQFPDIEAAGVEELFFSKNVTTAAMVWQARGVILEALQAHGIPHIQEVKPNQVKTAVAGNGAAKKPEIQTMVALTFGLKETPKPDDAADAAAVALATAKMMQFGI